MNKTSWFRQKSGSGGFWVWAYVRKQLTVEGSAYLYVFEKLSSTDTVNV